MRLYDPRALSLFVNGALISGYAKGDDVIKVSRREDSASDEVGIDGKMCVAVMADHSGEITIKLLSTSSSNKYLDGLLNSMEIGPASMLPVSIQMLDVNRQDMGAGPFGYIKRKSDFSRGSGPPEQEWTIVVEELGLAYGNPVFAGLRAAAEAAG